MKIIHDQPQHSSSQDQNDQADLKQNENETEKPTKPTEEVDYQAEIDNLLRDVYERALEQPGTAEET